MKGFWEQKIKIEENKQFVEMEDFNNMGKETKQ